MIHTDPTAPHAEADHEYRACPSAPAEEGMRQRRRDFTASEIARHAIALFVEQGFDEVTVDEIAAAAGISARTFFRYFPSKVDVVRDHQRFLFRRLVRALSDRPAAEYPIVALRAAFLTTAEMHPDDRTRMVRAGRLLLRDDLHVADAFTFAGAQFGALLQILIERGAEHDLHLEAVVGAMLGAANAAFRFWVHHDGSVALTEAMETAFTHVSPG